MSKHNDGGPAFARDSHIDRQTGLVVEQNGMSLRDYFAAAALHGLFASYGELEGKQQNAEWAYDYADAMLAERAKRKDHTETNFGMKKEAQP